MVAMSQDSGAGDTDSGIEAERSIEQRIILALRDRYPLCRLEDDLDWEENNGGSKPSPTYKLPLRR